MFEAMVFTNLTEDHLDFFLNIENYFNAKQKAFLQTHTKLAIINIDDSFGKRIYDCIKVPVITYSTNNKSSFMASDIKASKNYQTFNLGNVKFKINLLGKFNIYNFLPAIAYLNHIGTNLNTVSKLALNVSPVAGRFNTFLINQRMFVIDYAHTPDGLENVLNLCENLKESTAKLISVFGCGGNRETQKRQIMGEISSKIADFTIITSDNPRFESREEIAKDIEKGMINKNYKMILDRAQAIKYAYKISEPDDIILIAGKGVENYIDELGVKTPYSDLLEIEKIKENL